MGSCGEWWDPKDFQVGNLSPSENENSYGFKIESFILILQKDFGQLKYQAKSLLFIFSFWLNASFILIWIAIIVFVVFVFSIQEDKICELQGF